jgi:molybdopterin/thiamine biosynthesis adenylyltransferase
VTEILSPALTRLAAYLTAHDPECGALDLVTAKRAYGKDTLIAAAWRIRIEPGSDERSVDVLAHPDHPFEPVAIGIADLAADERPLSGVFTNSTLCLESPDDPLPIASDDSMIVEVLARVRAQMGPRNLKVKAASRDLEIAEYWTNRDGGLPTCFSLLANRGPSREVIYTEYGGDPYVAEDEAELSTWVVNAGKKAPKRARRTVLIDLTATPKTLPRSNLDLLEVARSLGDSESVALLESIAAAISVPVPIILRIPTADGNVFVAAWLDDPRATKGKKTALSTKWDGFKAGKAPLAILVGRFFVAAIPLQRGRIQRVDPEWLFSRGGNNLAPALLNARVVIVGAGSLGSSVARRLAKTGVGALNIIDPDWLSWDNIARHELGGRYVGSSKANAIAETLRRDFPHIEARAFPNRWEDVWRESPVVLRDANLIISTTAHTGSELHLNMLGRTEALPPLLFGWLEDRAAAAQVLFVGGIGGCLGCGLNRFGVFSERVVTNQTRTIRRVPGCDAFYQPYSALEADAAITLIAEAAIDVLTAKTTRSRLVTWIGARDLIQREGCSISDDWIVRNGDPGDGRTKVSRDWGINMGCPLCGD